MRRIIKLGIGAVGVVALTAGPAFADIQPANSDVVGVGSDTVQNIANFLFDGDTSGDLGYNASASKNRVFSFDATPDANDRAGYLNPSSNTALAPLTPTVVLRRGKSPVQRPNGSGAGIAALLADKTTPYQINFVRMSRPPKSAEVSSAPTAFGGIRTVKISDDDLSMAVKRSERVLNPNFGNTDGSQACGTTTGVTADTTSGQYCTTTSTNAPAGLSVAQLKMIYTCNVQTVNGVTTTSSYPWTAVGGTSSNLIIPLLPQAGSGTRSTFLGDIGVTTPGSCVQTVEENDPSAIANAAEPATPTVKDPTDAIDPFSQGRVNLFANGYFHVPTAVFPGGASLTPNVAILGDEQAEAMAAQPASSDGSTNYLDARGLYIVFRGADATSTTKFQPGGTLNYAQTLFLGAAATGTTAAVTPFVNTTAGQAEITAAGAMPDYVDEGNNFSVG